MRRIIYAMQFTSRAAPKDTSPTVHTTMTLASSCSLTSTAGPKGVHGTLQPVAGEVTDHHFGVIFVQ